MLTSCLDLMWPPSCPACDAPSEFLAFCAPCTSSLISGGDHACPLCGGVYLTPAVGGGDHPCGACLKRPPPFLRALGAYAYGAALRDAIIRWKNRPDHTLSPLMCALMVRGHEGRSWERAPSGTLVLPIPSPRMALARRGFNPAGLLARAMARRWGWTLIHGLSLRRTKRSSLGLTRRERERRLRGSFKASSRRLKGRDIVLVDDVMTTGATVRAATRACRLAGARSVQIACLSRAPLDA
mgnify:CR=1 FL=1